MYDSARIQTFFVHSYDRDAGVHDYMKSCSM